MTSNSQTREGITKMCHFKGKIIVNGFVIEKEYEFIGKEDCKVGDTVCVSGVGFAIVTNVLNKERNIFL